MFSVSSIYLVIFTRALLRILNNALTSLRESAKKGGIFRQHLAVTMNCFATLISVSKARDFIRKIVARMKPIYAASD